MSAKSRNQALNALVCFYREGLHREPGELDLIKDSCRAKLPRRRPVVLTRGQARNVLEKLKGMPRMMAGLMLGSGLRISEVATLRVKDVDFERKVVTIRGGKGAKDRVTMLPEHLAKDLTAQVERVRRLHEADLAAGGGKARLPDALGVKKPREAYRLGWQFLFPGKNLLQHEVDGEPYRHHYHKKALSNAIRAGCIAAGTTEAVTSHSLRHTFATLMLEGGTDIRTVQELLGHGDVKTTQIYLHVMNRGVAARSPLDGF